MRLVSTETLIDWADYPLVESNPRKLSGTPILKGIRMPADGIVENDLGGSLIEEIADNFELPEGDIRELLSYGSMRNPAIGFEGLVPQQCTQEVAPLDGGSSGQNHP